MNSINAERVNIKSEDTPLWSDFCLRETNPHVLRVEPNYNFQPLFQLQQLLVVAVPHPGLYVDAVCMVQLEVICDVVHNYGLLEISADPADVLEEAVASLNCVVPEQPEGEIALELVENPVGVVRHRASENPYLEEGTHLSQKPPAVRTDQQTALNFVVMDQSFVEIHHEGEGQKRRSMDVWSRASGQKPQRSWTHSEVLGQSEGVELQKVVECLVDVAVGYLKELVLEERSPLGMVLEQRVHPCDEQPALREQLLRFQTLQVSSLSLLQLHESGLLDVEPLLCHGSQQRQVGVTDRVEQKFQLSSVYLDFLVLDIHQYQNQYPLQEHPSLTPGLALLLHKEGVQLRHTGPVQLQDVSLDAGQDALRALVLSNLAVDAEDVVGMEDKT